MRLIWSKRALRQRQNIFVYLREHDPAVADRADEALLERAKDLLQHPRLGRPGRVDGTRELILTDYPYVIAYRLRKQSLEIAAVLHAARRWPARFR